MKKETRGMWIGVEMFNDEIFLSIVARGKLTHEDYKTITPIIDSALKNVKNPKVIVLFDARGFEGWKMRAAWDDFKIGLKHGNKFEKIAIVSNKEWMKLAAKVGGWFTSGDIEYFEDKDKAIDWLAG